MFTFPVSTSTTPTTIVHRRDEPKRPRQNNGKYEHTTARQRPSEATKKTEMGPNGTKEARNDDLRTTTLQTSPIHPLNPTKPRRTQPPPTHYHPLYAEQQKRAQTGSFLLFGYSITSKMRHLGVFSVFLICKPKTVPISAAALVFLDFDTMWRAIPSRRLSPLVY